MRSVCSADRETARRAAFVLLACCLLFAGCHTGSNDSTPKETSATSTPVELKAQVDPAKAKIGEPVTFRITLEAAPGISVSIPDVGPRIQGLRIVDIGKEGPKKREGRIWSQRWYKLTADLAGSYVLPPVSVSYTDRAGKAHTTETKQIFLEVQSVLDQATDAKDIRDLKPLEKAKLEIPRRWIFLSAGGLLLLALLVGLFLYFRKKKQARQALRTPEEIAWDDLKALETTGLLEEERYREYVFGLSLIFRRYLEGKFHVPAAERTTEEILASLRNAKHMDKALKEAARRFLEETDPIKYRGLEPRAEETEAWRGRLVSFMEHAAETEDVREAA